MERTMNVPVFWGLLPGLLMPHTTAAPESHALFSIELTGTRVITLCDADACRTYEMPAPVFDLTTDAPGMFGFSLPTPGYKQLKVFAKVPEHDFGYLWHAVMAHNDGEHDFSYRHNTATEELCIDITGSSPGQVASYCESVRPAVRI
jgi:hypothetical protein